MIIKNNLVIKIGGEAGSGIMATGKMLAKSCSRGGLCVFDYLEYPSLIRGGHNNYEVRISEEEIYSQIQKNNLLLAFNRETIDLHADELVEGGAIIYDSEDIGGKVNLKRKDLKLYEIPLVKLAQEKGGEKVMRNTVALGAIVGLLNYDFEILKGVIKSVFAKKGEEVIKKNWQAARAGFDYAEKKFAEDFPYQLEKIKAPQRMVIDGNSAIALGAIQSGCKFLAAYPMTPATSILHYFASQERQFNLVIKHTEDEIAAMNMIIGAGFAGVRAMTCTSGGGFALMGEALGMAGISEVPIVAVEAQRGGPSTGIPTWTEQGDLRFVLHASQGEFPRVLITPGDIKECFYLTFLAFNLAEKYQLPILILTDKTLASSSQSYEIFKTGALKIERGKYLTAKEVLADKNFARYKYTQDGISPRSFPGQAGGLHIASSYEHDETGFTTEAEAEITKMKNKRFKKLESLVKDLPKPELQGEKNAEMTIISWGSNKGAIREAVKLLAKEGIEVNFLNLSILWPFPAPEIAQTIRKAKNTLLVEVNQTAQLGGLIREQTGLEIKHKLLKYGGRGFWPEEITAKVKVILNGASRSK